MSSSLTKRQKDVLDYIKRYEASHGFPPTIREICKGVNLSSTATVFVHIKNLEKNGYIKSSSNKFRTLELLVDNEYKINNDATIKVPLLGKIAAGHPITAIENPNEYFDLPSSMVPSNSEVFLLKVSGESMIEAGIYDSDLVIIKRQNNAKNGQIVVAMTDEDEVTLKRFYKEKNHIRLQPENSSMSPIILDNCSILGIAIGLYRTI